MLFRLYITINTAVVGFVMGTTRTLVVMHRLLFVIGVLFFAIGVGQITVA